MAQWGVSYDSLHVFFYYGMNSNMGDLTLSSNRHWRICKSVWLDTTVRTFCHLENEAMKG